MTALPGFDGARVSLLAGSSDPNAKLTLVVLDPDGSPERVVKVPTTEAAARLVRREGELLATVRGRVPQTVTATLPAVLGWTDVDGMTALITSGLPGVRMLVGYHAWRHTARPRRVAADFAAAGAWLAALHAHPSGPPRPVVLCDRRVISARFPDAPLGGYDAVAQRLAGLRTPCTVIHGDYWAGNLLLADGAVRGVVDWEAGALSGEPLRDVARFVLSYALYLDRHTRPGRRVFGHPGLRAGPFGAGIAYALTGDGWFAAQAREFTGAALRRLGCPADAWRDVLVAGIADVVATADDPEFALAHLRLLTSPLASPHEEVVS